MYLVNKSSKDLKISLQNSEGGVIPLIKQYLNFFHLGHYNTAYYTPINNLASLNERITQYDLRQIKFPFIFSSFYKFLPSSWRSKNDLQRGIVQNVQYRRISHSLCSFDSARVKREVIDVSVDVNCKN